MYPFETIKSQLNDVDSFWEDWFMKVRIASVHLGFVDIPILSYKYSLLDD